MIELPIMSVALAFTTVSGIMSLWNYKGGKEGEIINCWRETMRHANLYNKDADNNGRKKHLSTFEVYKILKTKYGFKMIVTIPKGQKFSTLEDNKEIIENGLKANIQLMENKLSATATIKVNNKPFDLNEHWRPLFCESNELYIGRDLFKKDIIVDSCDYPHCLVSGATGSGKSIEIFSLVTNLISIQKGIGLWLAQVSDKRDVMKFKDCKQTRYFAYNLDKAFQMFGYIRKIIRQRNEILNKYNLNNIYEYNKKFKNNKWDYEYIVIDEFSSFMVDENKSIDAFYTIKQRCNVELQHIIKEGRSSGVFLICATQRPSKESMLPIFRSGFGLRISFKQNNLPSARVVSDNVEEIIRLDNREALVEYNKSIHIKTLYMDNSIITQYIGDSIEKNHKYVDITKNPEEIEEKEDKNKEKSKEKKDNLLDDIAVFISHTDKNYNKVSKELELRTQSQNRSQSQKKGKVKKDVKL